MDQNELLLNNERYITMHDHDHNYSASLVVTTGMRFQLAVSIKEDTGKNEHRRI